MLVYLFADQPDATVWAWLGGLLLQVVLAGLASFATGYAVLRFRNRELQRRSIDAAIGQYIQLGIQYPEMEDPTYCEAWQPEAESNIKRVRYEFFCCFIFNLSETLHTFHGGKDEKIKEHFHVDEVIDLHYSWWSKNRENNFGYEPKFRDFVKRRWEHVQKRKSTEQ